MTRKIQMSMHILLFLLPAACVLFSADSFCAPVPQHRIVARSHDTLLRSLSLNGGNDNGPLKDYSHEASYLFENIRIPAALFAGVSAGAAFSLPLTVKEGLKLRMVKRVYALLMIVSLSSQIIALMVATLSITSIATKMEDQKTASSSLKDFLLNNYDLEWTMTKFHFLCGLMSFVLASGLRAMVSINCLLISRAAVGIILSAFLTSLSFVQSLQGGLLHLPSKLIQLSVKRARRDPFFTVAMLCSIATWLYIIMNASNVYVYLI